MNLENPQNVKCLKCKCYRSEASFFNDKGRRLKTCQNCRDLGVKSREKCKCEHGRQKSQCRECKGSSICEHDRQRRQCIECKGSSICEHDKRRTRCIECKGSSICEHDRIRSRCRECKGSSICEHDKRRDSCIDCDGSSICDHGRRRDTCKICSDPIKVTIKTMLKNAKDKDKKNNRYDIVNFVDYCFIENLLDDYKCCYYEDCKKELQILDYNQSLVSLERINNNIGHTKSNCVICCLECNHKKKSNETTC